jgi:hypothetical protein
VTPILLFLALLVGQPPRLDSATAAAIERIIARATADGLPGDVVRAKALEGVSRGVPGDRIVRIVTAYAETLRVSRQLLAAAGDRSPTSDDLVAAAHVVSGGVSHEAAGALAHAANDRNGTRVMIVPFVVTGDLVARGVPADSAAVAVTAALRRGASDAQLWRLREAIALDIAGGVSPLESAMLRSGAGTARPPAVRPP